MSLGESTRKEILKRNYNKFRSRADDARAADNHEEAAGQYEKCANIVAQLAELETRDPVAAERESLAADLQTLADRLRAGELETSDDDTDKSPGDGGDSDDRSADSGNSDGDDDIDAEQFLVESPSLDFDDVGGMTAIKNRLRETVIDPVRNPELYERYGLGTVDGVLLHGPPGTGKTFLTRALAGRLDFNYIELEASDLTSSLVGEAADNVAEVFEAARASQPCLVFLDEIDAIAAERAGGARKTMSESQMITQFLTEMSSLGDTDVVFVAATNLPDEIDGAAWRRFDVRVEVPPPDAEGRAAVLDTHLAERPVTEGGVDTDRLAALTDGYTPSDLELVVDQAAREALSETEPNGEFRLITQSHLEAAVETTDPSLDAWDG
jgi:transitional endoplasmic reticulum ATPase